MLVCKATFSSLNNPRRKIGFLLAQYLCYEAAKFKIHLLLQSSWKRFAVCRCIKRQNSTCYEFSLYFSTACLARSSDNCSQRTRTVFFLLSFLLFIFCFTYRKNCTSKMKIMQKKRGRKVRRMKKRNRENYAENK